VNLACTSRYTAKLTAAILVVAGALVALTGPPASAAPTNSLQLSPPVSQVVGATGETFFDKSFKINTPSGAVALSGAADGVTPFAVDDVLELTVTRADGSSSSISHDFSDGCSGTITPLAPGDLNLLPLLGAGTDTVRVVLKDKCGSQEGNTALWLVGDLTSIGTTTRAILALGDSVAAGYGLGYAPGNFNPPAGAFPSVAYSYSADIADRLHMPYLNLAEPGACAAADDAPAPRPGSCQDPAPVSAQIDASVGSLAQLNETPALITLTVGADSIEFSECLTAYLEGKRNTAADPCSAANLTRNLTQLGSSLRGDLDKLHRLYPAVPVVVTDYYDPVPPPIKVGQPTCGIAGALLASDLYDQYLHNRVGLLARVASWGPPPTRIPPAEFVRAQNQFSAFASHITGQLDQAISLAAADGTDRLTRISFAGHDMCAGKAQAWVFGPALRAGISVHVPPGIPFGHWFFFGYDVPASPATCQFPIVDPKLPSFDVGQSTNAIRLQLSGSVNCMPHPTLAGQSAIADQIYDGLPPL